MLNTLQATASTISAPLFANAGAIVSVTAASGATCVVEYTQGSLQDINNNVATWAVWPKGTVTSGATFSDLANDPMYIRIKPASGLGTLSIEDAPTADALKPYRNDFGTTAGAGAFSTLSASGATSLAAVSASGVVSGTGFSNYMAAPPSIGTTTPGIVKTSNLQATYTDSSGTPGNVTNSSPRGRVALAAAASTIVVTSTLVSTTSMVKCQLRSVDGAATSVVSCLSAAGSFTITFNAASTGTAAQVDFLVIN